MKQERVLRIYAEFTGDTASVLRNLAFGSMKNFVQSLADDFIADCIDSKELKKHIIRYLDGGIKLKKVKTDDYDIEIKKSKQSSETVHTESPGDSLKDFKKNINF